MTTAALEPAAKRWECWECTALPEEDPVRRDCICKVHRPTHVIGILLEPLPPDVRVQASMLSGKLRMGREQVHAARENANFEEKYDPIEAEKLREDALRWQLRVDRIEGELRRVLAELNAVSKAADAGAGAAKPAVEKRAGRKSARAPRARAARLPKPATKSRPAAKGASPESSDGPGSGDPPPSDPDPERPAPTAGQGTVAERRPLLERTRDFWQRRTSRRLSLEDAREIVENSVGFIRLLNTWATKKPADPSTLPGGTDGTDHGTVPPIP
jgi:hypothetical protein